MGTVENIETEKDDVEVAEAGNYLRTQVIPKLVKKLDSLEIIPIDSVSLSQALHSHGINIRFLGTICQQTNLPHVREICIIEMIARAAKKIFRKQLNDLIFNLIKEDQANYYQGILLF